MATGHFGSAGSSRSLRRTATAVSAGGSTGAAWRDKIHVLARLDEPSKTEVMEAARTGQCCFCTSPKTYKWIAHHFVRTHGINLDELRDRLVLPKSYPFASEEVRAKFSANSKRRAPEMLAAMRAGIRSNSRVLNSYGRLIQKQKANSYERPKAAIVPCPVCGGPKIKKKDQLSCGAPACKAEMRRRGAQSVTAEAYHLRQRAGAWRNQFAIGPTLK